MIYTIDEAASSNDVARDRRYVSGDIVWVEHQTAGRGQRGHSWSGADGLDLTFSMVVEPASLPVARQFLLLRATALALVDTFAACNIATRIKWTNDIYAGGRKITGVLIENDISNGMISRSVVGIGINVNRRSFPAELPNPTSMLLESGREFDRRSLLETFESAMASRLEMVRTGEWDELAARYDSLLYLKDEHATFSLPDGTVFDGVLRGTAEDGRLLVERTDGTVNAYAFREIGLVLKK